MKTSPLGRLFRRLRFASSRRASGLVEDLERALSGDLDEQERYRIAEVLASAVYPDYKFSEFGRLFLEDKEFLAYYEKFMDPGNWHSMDRKYVLNELLKFALLADGDAAEAGVYKGASSYLVCKAIAGSDRRHHLFDSFEGLSAPRDLDGDYWRPGSLSTPENHVHRALEGFSNYTVYKGWIPERFSEVADRRFCFVHVDVDLYEPTKQSIDFFYPRMSTGGVLLLDDVGFKTCPGATKAATDYFETRSEPLMHLPTGQAFAIKT